MRLHGDITLAGSGRFHRRQQHPTHPGIGVATDTVESQGTTARHGRAALGPSGHRHGTGCSLCHDGRRAPGTHHDIAT